MGGHSREKEIDHAIDAGLKVRNPVLVYVTKNGLLA
jgi:hypothetical protein